jgi:uncharacterized protein Yka (UPF0111/DUF47 family)
MEPEELRKLQKIESDIDKMYDAQTRKLFDYMLLEGEKAFEEGNPLNKFLGTDLFERLISHFESTEEYEKCAYILNLYRKIKSDYIKNSFKDLENLVK